MAPSGATIDADDSGVASWCVRGGGCRGSPSAAVERGVWWRIIYTLQALSMQARAPTRYEHMMALADLLTRTTDIRTGSVSWC